MKKKTESVNALDTNRIVHVDLGKLSEGLALTFKGVTEVFESLGADEVPGFGTVSTTEPTTEPTVEPTTEPTVEPTTLPDPVIVDPDPIILDPSYPDGAEVP